VSAQHPGLVVKPREGTFRELKELDLEAVTITRGGKFAFEYELSAEQMGKGLFALVALLGMASGQRVGDIPDVKLESIRKEIDSRLQKEVPPRFIGLVKQYDHLVPGLSLSSVFGV
jgi:hypothetical protein